MFNFLNPTILFALAAAAIPLLIHLLNRRKIKKIPFSTIHFLKKMEKKQMRSLKVRQWLLLFLRMLIIALIVLAFARPTLQSGAGNILAERSAIETVIIIDNSMSMNEARLTGSLLEQVRKKFSALEPVFRAGDKISIIQSTRPVKFLVKQENYQADIWERTLQKIQPNYLKSDLDHAILTTLDLLKNSAYYGKEIYILSDFQKTAMQNKELENIVQNFQAGDLKIFILPVSHESSENISVDSVEVINRLIELNQTLRVQAILKNHDSEKYLTTLTSIILNGNRVGQQNIQVPARKPTDVQFEINLTENGFVSGSIETESDVLTEDNRYFFNFYVPNEIKILHFTPDRQFQSFLPMVIQPALSQGIFEYKEDVIGSWANYNFMDYDIVILESLNEISETLNARLEYYVRQGGGGFIIPGNDISVAQYRELAGHFKIGMVEELRGKPGQSDEFLTLDKIQWNDPIFEGLFEKEKQNFNPIEVYASYHMTAARNSQPVLGLSDGSGYLLKSHYEKGIVFLMASPLQLKWTQLPLKGFLVPLMYRAIYFAGIQKIVDRQNIKSGEPFYQLFTNLEAPFEFTLVGPEAHEEKLTPQFKGSNILLQVKNTDIPGNYTIMHNNRVLTVFSVNPWREESVMDFYGANEIDNFLPGSISIEASDGEALFTQIQNSRFGKELWKHFLVLALILLFVEMILARTGSRKEFTEATIVEQASA